MECKPRLSAELGAWVVEGFDDEGPHVTHFYGHGAQRRAMQFAASGTSICREKLVALLNKKSLTLADYRAALENPWSDDLESRESGATQCSPGAAGRPAEEGLDALHASVVGKLISLESEIQLEEIRREFGERLRRLSQRGSRPPA